MRLFPRAATAVLCVTAVSAVVGGTGTADATVAHEAAPSADETVTMKTVKYADLVRTVRDLQGKVVVVDFWAHY
jgi:hypothetical protein